jgi:hypothetical protein
LELKERLVAQEQLEFKEQLVLEQRAIQEPLELEQLAQRELERKEARGQQELVEFLLLMFKFLQLLDQLLGQNQLVLNP